MSQGPPRSSRQATPQAARTATPEPPAPLLALRPRRHRAVWALLICTYPLLAGASFWQTDLHSTNSAHLLISAAVFVIRTLWFHVGLMLAAIAAWALWRRRRWLLLATIAPLLATLGPDMLLYLPKTPPRIGGQRCTVMQFNLLYTNAHTDLALAEIRKAAPHVLLLQEYSPDWDAAIYPALAGDYPHVARGVRAGPFGWAVYSRLPLAGQPEVIVSPRDGRLAMVRLEMLFGDRRVAVYGIHLWPAKRMDLFVAQWRLLLLLTERVASEELPVIVCGDFNFTARHEMHRAMLGLDLDDAHDLAGWGRGSTWPMIFLGRFLPGFRIDHMYVGGGLTCAAARTGSPAGSDHRPLIAEIGFAADRS